MIFDGRHLLICLLCIAVGFTAGLIGGEHD